MRQSIPVIGTAVVNGVHWIKRLIESIDYPTDNFVVFNNNGRNQITEELNLICAKKYKFINKIFVCHFPGNIGCSGAWNMIIKSYINSPYWIIANHDIAFSNGFLEEMIKKADDEEVGIVHSSAGDFERLGSWELFLIKDWVIKEYGLFDENLYPAYGEDIDYLMRFWHDPIKRVLGVGKPYYHGDGFNYYESGQQTKKGEEGLEEKLNIVNSINFEYLEKKWGPHWRMAWPYFYPWDNKNISPLTTSFDLKYVRSKHLGF